jgi:hypothetical protein
MKKFILFIVLTSGFQCVIFSEELLSGFRVGYDNFGGSQVQYMDQESSRTAEINDWNNPLYLSGIALPNYITGGLGYSVKYGYKNLNLNKQRFILDESSSPGGNIMMNKSAELGTKIEGKMAYVMPTIYYHLFKESSISLILGIGMGLAYSELSGKIYITDAFEEEKRDQDCYDYLNNNKNYQEINQYCETYSVEQNGVSQAWGPQINIQGENFGFEFGWVNTTVKDKVNKNVDWQVNMPVMALYYQFNFD